MVESEEVKRLKAQIEAFNKPAAVAEKSYTLSESELKNLIAEAVKQATEPKKLTLEEALEIVFSKDDRDFFANPKNFGRLPNFIVSDNGKRLITEMFGEFKKWLQ